MYKFLLRCEKKVSECMPLKNPSTRMYTTLTVVVRFNVSLSGGALNKDLEVSIRQNHSGAP